jgi:hypothetical protein
MTILHHELESACLGIKISSWQQADGISDGNVSQACLVLHYQNI